MSFLSLGKTGKVAVVDFASSSVGLLVSEKEREKKKTCQSVLFSDRSDFFLGEAVNLNSFLTKTFKSLDEVFQKLSLKHLGKIDEVHCFLSSPFFISQTINKTYKSPKTKVTEKFVREMVEAEVQKCLDSSSPLHPEIIHDNLSVIEKKILDIKLNGYSVDEPYGKVADEVELSIFISFGSKKIIHRIEQIILGKVHHKKVFLHTYPVTLFNMARDLFPEKEEVLILDIGGEISDLIVVNNGVLSNSVSIPFGENTLIRKVTKEFATTNEEVLSVLKLHAKDSLSDVNKNKIEEKLGIITTEWLDLLKKALEKVLESYFLPEVMLFVGGRSEVSELVKTMIEKNLATKLGITSKDFTLKTLDYKMLRGLCSGEVTEDTVLLLETVFTQKINQLV